MPTYPNIQMVLTANPPTSERMPRYKLMSYQWLDSGEDIYTGRFPIALRKNDPLTFVVHDYTKTLSGPSLKVQFEPFPGDRDGSPFSRGDTNSLRSGVDATLGPVDEGDFNLFTFGPFTLADTGVEFEFSLEIDDDAKPPHRWFVDPQMIVEEG